MVSPQEGHIRTGVLSGASGEHSDGGDCGRVILHGATPLRWAGAPPDPQPLMPDAWPL
jgi:hypothetical protein